MRWMWSLGDYSRVAEVLEPYAEALAEFCGIRPRTTVLDVAAGNGNFALAAARRGAIVTATDLTPRMIDLGRARTAHVSEIEWAEADAEQLRIADATYDVVASVFGAQFAPRPQLVAAEMFRVAKPGGLVAMANYSPGGFLGGMGALLASFSAHPAFELPSPFQWGDEEEVRHRFEGLAKSIDFDQRKLYFEGDSVEGFLAFWEETNAPQNALRTMMPPHDYQQVRAAATSLFAELNESTDGRLKLSSPYLLVRARKLS